MKYKLIKEYPGSPKLGNTIDNLENDWIEDYPEFWEEVVEIKTPLFTTEDGVDIYKDDYSYGVHNSKFDIVKIKHISTVYVGDNFIEFSTKEKAEEYILLNKPCLSINDIKNTFPRIFDREKELIKLVKSKIKQSV